MGGFSSITGQDTIMNADNASFDGSERAGVLATNGQIWIGSTAVNSGGTHINVGSITSPSGTLTIGYSSPNITLDLAGGSAAVEHLTGNSGGQLNPTANNFNIITANATVKFAGSGSTLTQNFGLTNLLIGSTGSSIAGAQFNVSLGNNALAGVTSGQSQTCVGSQAGFRITTGTANTLIGADIGINITSGSNNTCIGSSTLPNLTTGSNNLVLGCDNAASAYTTTESNNIILGNAGTALENNVLRIGTQGSGTRQQNQCFIAGIVGVTNSNPKTVTINSSTGQLGVTNGSVNTWTVITADQTAVVNNGYICNKASALLLTLPATAIVGDIIRVTGINTALGWKIVQNANQQIFFGATSTTLGATGFLQSAAIRDSVEIVCVVAGASTIYNVISSVGNITVS